jgi:hypothetical protein
MNNRYNYAGNSYWGNHGYGYHGWAPYGWGGAYHPWGWFAAGLATTAVAVAIAGSNDNYYYDQGNWYAPSGGGYTTVAAPVGGTVESLPPQSEPVSVNNVTNYYYGGSYYEKTADGYTVIAPPAGAVVEHLPEGVSEVKMGDRTYFKLGSTFYQPIVENGVNKFEVVQVTPAQ